MGYPGLQNVDVHKHWTPAFYFLFYAAGASLSPFLVIFYQSKGLEPGDMGLLGAIPPVMMLLGAPLWSSIADAFDSHRTLFGIATCGAIVAVGVLSRMIVLQWIALSVAAYAFFASPVMPLVDSATLIMLGDRRDTYGHIRLWGALGWGIAAPLVGALVQQSGLMWPFAGYIAFMIVGLFVGMKLPLSRVRIPSTFRHGVHSILTSGRWRLFLFIVFVCGVGLSAVSVFLFLYMKQLGASETVMGLALTSATVSELPFFFFTDRLLRRWSARGLLLFGMTAYVLRAILYSFVTAPWQVLLIQLLHGPTFSAIWVAGVSYANEIAPQGLSTTAQGIFNATFMGLGSAVGALFAGVLYQYLGVNWMFRIMGLTVAVATLLLIIAGRWHGQKSRLAR
ncbi:MAG TPA: major facilitator superfamily domain-containing protein 6 [Spirochaetia bacterium]|nr:major facilitator superfamily domain-containing protein 6 [Spirochaetia bacterium]